MQIVRLGRTGIEVSRLGMGTGTADPAGLCVQAIMNKEELSGLLLYAHERGINLWDTAFQYGTYPHIREALRHVGREKVVLASKFTTSSRADTMRDFESSLRDLGTDYIDVSLVHGVRTRAEFKKRMGALEALLELKEKGMTRAVGFSSHGLSALRQGLELSEVDVVWARVNYAGLNMDARSLGLYERMASVPWLKSMSRVIPRKALAAVRPGAGARPVCEADFRETGETLNKLHRDGRGVVGMKVLAEGLLSGDAERAVQYVMGLDYVDAFIVGMLNKDEIDRNCALIGA